MKKISLILVLFLSLALLLTACNNDPPISKDLLSNSSVIQYEEAKNPYNVQTATNDKYIFIVQEGSICRVNRRTAKVEQIIKNEEDSPRIAGAPNIAVFDNHIYFLCANNILEVAHGQEDTLTMGIYRATLDGKDVKQVVTIENGVHQLFAYDGFLITYTFNVLEESSPNDSYRFFIPDGSVDTLEEVPLTELDTDRLVAIDSFINPQKNQILIKQAAGDTPYNTAIKANDAYYYLNTMNRLPEIHQLPFSEQESKRINLSSEVAEILKKHSPTRFVNYDADWLYFSDDSNLFRICKDGSYYQLCIENISHQGYIDVVDSYLIYTSDAIVYMASVDGSGTPVIIY